MALLYPLDTVKVRCQAAGISSRKVLASMYSSTGGNWAAMFPALYAGILPGMALSVLVGSVHYACFCATRRLLGRLAVAAEADSKGSTGSRQQQQQAHVRHGAHSQHVMASHGATGTHYIPIEDYSEEQDSAEQQQQRHIAQAGDSSKPTSKQKESSSQAQTAAVAGGTAHEQHSSHPEAGEGNMAVNVAAAVITAALTAVFEAPLELFRHNSQAGQIQGNFVKEMWKVRPG